MDIDTKGLPWQLIRSNAELRPLGVDVSDYSDEYVRGFLAGQVNLIDWLDNPDRDRHIAEMNARFQFKQSQRAI